MTRYNPDTNRATEVPADSWEADNWPSRKPSQASRKALQKAERAVERTVTQAVQRTLTRGRLPEGVPKVTLPQAFMLAAAGVASYYGTTFILDQIKAGATDPKFIAAMALRRARVALAQKLGRELVREELQQLQRQVVETVGRRLMLTRAMPFGLGEILSAVTGGRF